MTNFQRTNSFLKTVWMLISDYCIEVSIGLISIVLGALGLLNNANYSSIVPDPQQRETIQVWTSYLFFIFTLLAIIVLFIQLRKAKRFSTLKEEIELLRKEVVAYDRVVYKQTDSFLSTLSRDILKFGTNPDCDERITIYVHDSDGYFVPVGRYSENPNLEKKGRSKYPDDQGFIAKAWQRDFCFANDYPDPDSNSKAYIRRLSEDKMPADIIAGLKMKSRLFFGCRIKNLQTQEPIALLIIEATKINRYKEKDLKYRFNGKLKIKIATLLQELEPILPIISEPRRFGL